MNGSRPPKTTNNGAVRHISLRSLFALTVVAAVAAKLLSACYDADRREHLAANRVIDLGGTVVWQRRHSVSALPGESRCTSVFLSQCNMRGADLSFLNELPALKELYLSGSGVANSDLPLLAQLSSLEVLNIGGADVNDEGLAKLRACKRLRQLLFAKTHVKGRSLRTLAELRGREVIVADYCQLDDAALHYLATFPTLKILVASSEVLSDKGLAALVGAPLLEELSLVGDFTNEGIKVLSRFPALRHALVFGRDGLRVDWHREPVNGGS